MKKLILASSSIHRKKLLKQLKVKFTCISPDIDESRKINENINDFVKRLSIEKTMKVAQNKNNSIIIGSDEVAVVNKKILGKPLTAKNARKQLMLISNKDVIFKTGLCVYDTDTRKKLVTVVNYRVTLRKLNKSIIEDYISKEDILNCAASIRMEGYAIKLVKSVKGDDPTSIIGLPLIKLTDYLITLGYLK
tara:strand:- start:3180 stop:3755 length:576 start_codon:yes stop_codon:yes gene_type:complete